MDPLRMGMGWRVEDLDKPQIMVESTFGDSHPGSAHLNRFVEEAVQGVNESGGKAARYFATDMCDGIAQGHDGINYSLPHRDAIVNLVEAQANATGFDGGVFIASCDKSMPAMLMSIGRLKEMSAIVVTGGVMEAHMLPKQYVAQDPACAINELLTLEQIGKYDAWEKTGVIPTDQLEYYKHNACPSCGACSFMGTASTMQIMAEALGLMLPGTALMPATAPELAEAARQAGRQLMELVKQGIRAEDIVTMKSFENAIMVHAAISGSTNATMHLPAIAHEFGFTIDADTFDRMHRGAHYLLNIRPSGDWPAQYFYYAGGVPRVMEEIKSMLHLDVMTVTGKTLGENLEDLKKSGFYEHCDRILREKTEALGLSVSRTDIIHDFDHAKGTDGSIAILRGNLAPEGCVIKHTACPKNMFRATLRAKPYDSEEACIDAVLHGKVQHVHHSDHIRCDRTDRIGGILHRMRVGCHMQHIIHLSEIIPDKRLVYVVRNEPEERRILPLRESGKRFLLVAAERIDGAVEPCLVLFHQHIHKKRADQARRSGDQYAFPLQFLPRQTKLRHI